MWDCNAYGILQYGGTSCAYKEAFPKSSLPSIGLDMSNNINKDVVAISGIKYNTLQLWFDKILIIEVLFSITSLNL